jgi:hypothetical protein
MPAGWQVVPIPVSSVSIGSSFTTAPGRSTMLIDTTTR